MNSNTSEAHLQTTASGSEALDFPYTLFSVDKTVYGINSRHVVSVEILDKVNTINGSYAHIRGGTLYRGNFLELTDMRKLFGLGNQIEDFERLLDPQRRIQEHLNWVNELETSVRERRPFTLTDDPHKCAFGQWYDSFETDNITLKHSISSIDIPHQAVHHGAKRAKILMQQGSYTEAEAMVEELRNTHVKTVIDLIDSLVQTMASNMREMYIVIQTTVGLKGLIVDAVVGVEPLTLLEKAIPAAMQNTNYISGIYQRRREKTLVMVLDIAAF